MTDLQSLIDRLGEATGPDRELDVDIALAIGFARERDGNYLHTEDGGYVLERDYYDIEGSAPELPRYSASIDSALKLLAAGVEWALSTLYGIAHAEVGLNCSDTGPVSVSRNDGNVPLAICQAAIVLRARAAQKGRSSE
jgi:hypothetical protein